MAKLVPVECPNCGAHLQIDPDRSSATCSYCGTTSTVERRSPRTPPAPPAGSAAPRVIYVDRKRPWSPVFIGGLVLVGFVVGVVLVGRSPSAPASAPSAAPSFPVDVAAGETDFYTGRWIITAARNPGADTGYRGDVEIRKVGATYHLAWAVAGASPYRGIGLATDDGIGVGWGAGEAYGVAVYSIDGGRLEGRWATESSRRTAGTETLVGPASLDGTFEIEDARTPDGKSYRGRVTIEPRGETHVVRWKLDGSGTAGADYSGVGVRRGDELVVGWAAGASGSGVVVYRKKGDALSGSWTHPDARELGSEDLGRP